MKNIHKSAHEKAYEIAERLVRKKNPKEAFPLKCHHGEIKLETNELKKALTKHNISLKDIEDNLTYEGDAITHTAKHFVTILTPKKGKKT